MLVFLPLRHYTSTAEPAGPEVLLLHGFDSSSLEWRRLVPLLEEKGLAPTALDVLGTTDDALSKAFYESVSEINSMNSPMRSPNCAALRTTGWGFSEAVNTPTSAAAKRRHLHAFWQQVTIHRVFFSKHEQNKKLSTRFNKSRTLSSNLSRI